MRLKEISDPMCKGYDRHSEQSYQVYSEYSSSGQTSAESCVAAEVSVMNRTLDRAV